jgi:putative transposase
MSKYNPRFHHLRSIRLKGYDYSREGLYFITLCVQNRKCLFGQIENHKMILNEPGRMVETEWLELATRFPTIELHEQVVMPNHFHGIIELKTKNSIIPTVGASLMDAPDDVETTDNVGQPQGIASNGQPQGISPNGQPQGISSNGQPQGISPNGQPQGIASNGQPQGIAPTRYAPTIGDIMDAFKLITTVEYIQGVKNYGWKPFDRRIWQRNYWEHIIRNIDEYNRIADYISANPSKWNNDQLNPGNSFNALE